MKYEWEKCDMIGTEDIAAKLAELAELSDEEQNEIEKVVADIKTIANNPYNADCWRTFYNALEILVINDIYAPLPF